uniref:Protein kinase 4-like n=1 Tax=Dermatophagoides pteronyssinus TaxID=6956 RepID=A0A6P6YLJ0_DERPT|nr:protein kinase 4-like [Dermatophagoides pteronyssinus]
MITMLSNPLTSSLISQNHRYMTKTPERDLHYQTILKQQEQATIRHPFQAFQLAKDQANMRGHMLRSSLQTSDDDVYEVESAPVMKTTSPYQYHSLYSQFNNNNNNNNVYRSSSSLSNRYRLPPLYSYPLNQQLQQQQHYYQQQQQESSQPPIELPSISMSFDPNPYQQQQQSTINESPSPSYQMYNSPLSYHQLQRKWPQKRFSNWVDFGRENGRESRTKELTTSIRVAPFTSSFQPDHYNHNHNQNNNQHSYHYRQQQQPNQHQYEMEPETKNLFMTIGFDQTSSASNNNDNSNDYPDTYETSASQQQQKIFNTQLSNNNHSESILPSATTTNQQEKLKKNQQQQDDPTSSWLDMGAYSANKGEFGWFTDTPVIVGHKYQQHQQQQQQPSSSSFRDGKFSNERNE